MNKNICRALVLGASLAMASACSSSTASNSGTSSAVTQLFMLEPTPDRSTLQKTATGYLATLLADPANQEITLVKVDPAVVSNKTQDLAVTLPNGQAAQFHLRDYNTITPGIDGWVGYKPSAWKQKHVSSSAEIDMDPRYYLSLARDGDKLVGNVIVGGQPYRIEYVSPGQHALIKVDESKLPRGEDALEPDSTVRAETIGNSVKSAHSIIRVLFATTNETRATKPNARADLAQALNDANQYMKNSRIEITFELAGYIDPDYSEGDKSLSTQLNDMRLFKPFADVILNSREALVADLVSLYSTNATANCGRAWIAPGKAQGHSVVSCRGSLAHELGHNLGGRHNWKEGDPEGSEPNSYSHGYWRATDPKFYTQMSYPGFCGANCPQVQFFSNPRVMYQGVPMGTVEHHDVARRFNERRETVENFYPPMPFKKIKNVMREASGVPACLMVTTSGALGFTDCDGSSNDLPRRQWGYNSIPPALSIQNRLVGHATCLQYTRKGSAPQMSGCPADISEAIKTFTAWYLILGTIQYNFLGIANCLTAGATDTSPVFDFCKGGFDQQWRAVD